MHINREIIADNKNVTNLIEFEVFHHFLSRTGGSDSNGTETNDLRLKVLKPDFNKDS